MADVFDGVRLEKHTGQGPMTVAELRAKYGGGLSVSANPSMFRILRGWERSQVEVIVLHFQDNDGDPVVGLEGRYFWPNSPVDGHPVFTNGEGNIDWAFNNGSYYDPRTEIGPYTFKAPGLTIQGLGSPSKNMPVNHDSMSFDILVSPAGPPPLPDPDPGIPPADNTAVIASLRSSIVVMQQQINRMLDMIGQLR